jgi:aspartate aminotransferase
MDHLEELRMTLFSVQILRGWARTSALLQHGLPHLEKRSLDVNGLQRRRDRFAAGL